MNNVFVTKKDQLVDNMKKSHRGGIRKQPNVLSWVAGLNKLTDDDGEVVREWNAKSAKSNQLVGAKAQTIKYLITLTDKETLDILMKIVSLLGWDGSPFSEDALSSRKIYPGKHFRSACKAWTNRQEVTMESMKVMFQNAINHHKKLPVLARRKVRRQDLEVRAEFSAIVCALAYEVTQKSPVPLERVQAEFVDKYAEADAKVEMEVQCVVSEKSASFTVRDVPTLASMMDSHAGGLSFDIVQSQKDVEKSVSNLEDDQFNLVMKQIEYDVKAFKIYLAKLRSFEKTMYTKKLEWNLKRHQFSKTAAKEWMDDKVCVAYCNTIDEVVKEYNKLVRDLATKHGVPQEQVVTLGIVNWVAPSTLTSTALEMQANIISMLCNGNINNIVPILCPQFAYKKGQLYLIEEMVFKLLSQRQINVDAKFGLLFEQKCDQRDNRRLVFDGRIAVPSGCNEATYLWRESQLMDGRTESAAMMPSRSMVVMEEMSDNALPPTTDSDGLVKGANKWQQVGEDAMSKLMSAALQGAFTTTNTILLVWEVNSLWGNGLDAFIAKESGWNFPAKYFTCTPDSGRAEWIATTKAAKLKSLHLEDKLKVPGFAVMPETIPQDLLEEKPSPPSMHKLAIVPVQNSTGIETASLACPDSITQTWYKHRHHGDAFASFLEAFHEEWGNHTIPEVGKKRAVHGPYIRIAICLVTLFLNIQQIHHNLFQN